MYRFKSGFKQLTQLPASLIRRGMLNFKRMVQVPLSMTITWLTIVQVILTAIVIIFTIIYTVISAYMDVDPSSTSYFPNWLYSFLYPLSLIVMGVITNRVDKFLDRPIRNQTTNAVKPNQDASQPKLARNKYDSDKDLFAKRLSTVLVSLIFVSTMFSVFQWRKAQQSALNASIAKEEAQRQAERAKEKESQIIQVSLANEKIINDFLQTISDPIEKGERLSEFGDEYQNRGLFSEALQKQKQAFEVYQETKYTVGQVLVLNKIGQLYHLKGEIDQALDHYQSAKNLLSSDNFDGLGLTLNNIGTLYQSQGQYQLALSSYEEAKTAYNDAGNDLEWGLTVGHIGNIYQELGNLESAEELYLQSLSIFEERNDESKKATIFRYLGSLYSPKDYDQALKYYTDALAIYRNINDSIEIGRTKNEIGDLHLQHNQYKEAFNFYNDSRNTHTQLNNQADLGKAFYGLGNTYRSQGDYIQALESYKLALDSLENVNDLLGQAKVTYGIGQTYEAQSDTKQAIIEYERSIELLEIVLSDIHIEEFKTWFINRHLPSYEHVIKLLWSEKQYEQAFRYAELARSRGFLDQVGNLDADMRFGVPDKLIEEEKYLLGQMKAAQQGLSAIPLSAQFQPDWRGNLDRTRKQYQDLIIRMKLDSPKYKDGNNPAMINVGELRKNILDDNVTLIEYFVSQDQIFAWVIDKEGLTGIELTVPKLTLQNFIEGKGIKTTSDVTVSTLVDRFYDDTAYTEEFDANLSDFLYQNLFAPLKKSIRHKNLIIIPHSILHKLPFAALWDTEEQIFLIENYTLSFAPSAHALKYILNHNDADSRNFVGLGGGQQSLIENEVQQISQLYAVKPYIGTEATESVLKNQILQADTLHIAFDEIIEIPEHLPFSYIELTVDEYNDGSLTIYEIYDLELSHNNLVVLSGSNANHLPDTINPSNDITSFAWAFLASGCPTVIAPAWKIDGAPTIKFMEAFYYNWVIEQKTASESLQQAQLTLIESDRWNAPYYWAAFSLNGDYRSGKP